MKLCGAPGGDVRSPTKIRCGLDFYLNGRKIERFPLKINWSHLPEVGERGIAVRWAYNMFTPRVRYCGVTE
jgi:hypothetical protein